MPGSQPKVNWLAIAGLILSLLGWAVTGMRAYGDDHSDLAQRVTKIETKQDDSEKQFQLLRGDIGELRGDIKKLLERR